MGSYYNTVENLVQKPKSLNLNVAKHCLSKKNLKEASGIATNLVSKNLTILKFSDLLSISECLPENLSLNYELNGSCPV